MARGRWAEGLIIVTPFQSVATYSTWDNDWHTVISLSKMLQKSQKKRSNSPFNLGRSRSPVPSTSRSGSGRSTPSTNGYAISLEERQASPAKDSPSQTPVDRRSLASLGSSHSSAGCLTPSSTMDGLTTPNLPMVVTIKKCHLTKRPPGSPVSGWGFVLRGTTSEFKSGMRVYTCHVEIVKDDGAAMVCVERDVVPPVCTVPIQY